VPVLGFFVPVCSGFDILISLVAIWRTSSSVEARSLGYFRL
jgi:hypothetical protein